MGAGRQKRAAYSFIPVTHFVIIAPHPSIQLHSCQRERERERGREGENGDSVTRSLYTIADRHDTEKSTVLLANLHPTIHRNGINPASQSLIQSPTHPVIEFAIFPNVIYSPFRNVGEHLVSRDKKQINFLRLLATIDDGCSFDRANQCK